jgi:hypothetical protein
MPDPDEMALIGVLRTVTRSASERAVLHSLAIRIPVGHFSVLRNTESTLLASSARLVAATRSYCVASSGLNHSS